MPKKIVKKKKLKVFHFLIFLLVIVALVMLGYLIINTKTKNIIIKNSDYISDEDVITTARIEDYPPFYLINTKKIEKKLEKNPLIERVTIKRKFYHVLIINIKSNKPLFYYEAEKKVVLHDGRKADSLNTINLRIPRVMNYIPNTKYSSLIKHIKKIDEDILGKISEITYVPNEYDKDRFLLYMDDGNTVYLTLTKFKMINYYNKVLPQLGGKEGILYLDSGNHFQIKN